MESFRLKKNIDSDENGSDLEILEEFPDSAYDLLKKLLDLDYEKRYNAENALKHEFFEI